jgi:uncharacterized membrane-anchored protein YhcB (DUF1043 family)
LAAAKLTVGAMIAELKARIENPNLTIAQLMTDIKDLNAKLEEVKKEVKNYKIETSKVNADLPIKPPDQGTSYGGIQSPNTA